MGWFKKRRLIEMEFRDAIGIDPDSSGFVLAYVKIAQEQVKKKSYHATESSMKNFIRWVKGEGDIIIAIEGSNGQSKPIEQALRENGIIFYSFTPGAVDKFRKAVLGENKNNEKDAEATARYAMSLEAQGKLNKFKRVWFPDEELQSLTRAYNQKNKVLNGEVNRLWKTLRLASPDLYLALGGNNPNIDIHNNILTNKSILLLLSEKPCISEWKSLSEADFSKIMGRNYKGRSEVIKELQKVSQTFQETSVAVGLLLRSSAVQILMLKNQMKEIETMLGKITAYNNNVKVLKEIKGISTLTSSTIIAELIDVRRFLKDGNLASYSGVVKKEHSTGEKKNNNDKRMRHNTRYNRRLKDAIMTAAKNFVIYNPDSHLTGYYKNLIKNGMSLIEARKRVARALCRVIFKKLNSLIEEESLNSEERESDMARGLIPMDIIDPSNISLLSGIQYSLDMIGNVKRKIS